ncbi:Polar tube protein 3 [Spraguea lophii 42_110]|uniref:Polar tube protein 3 n=1 Tax=Spraguea lophii (strain 42_110) TaxID=1358809 RepID=S7XW41_SPRLO|nr:Polar tube protein 3 [Spraguea lophii 42_110]
MIVKIFICMLLLSIYSCKHVHTHKRDKVINFDELESGKPFLEENKRELRHQLKNITHPFRRRRFGHSAHKKHKDHGYIKKRHANKNKHRKKDDDRDTEFADRVLRSIGDVDSVPHHREHHEHEHDSVPHHREHHEHEHDSVEHERMILDRMAKEEAEKKDAERKRNLEEIGRVTGAQVALEPLQDVKDKNMAKHIADQEALAAILGQPTTGDPTLKKVSHDSLHPMTSLEDEIREAFAQGFTREDIMKALGNTGLEMNEVAEAISNVIGKTPPSPSSHTETVEAVGSRTADEVDTMLKMQGVPGPTRKAVAAEAGGVAAQDANKKLTDKKIGQAHQMIEESMIMNKNMQNNLRENEARNEANAQKFRALRQGLPMETAEKLAKQAYDESMSITSNYNPGPDPYVVKDAAEQAANAVESYHQTAGSNPIEAKVAAEETAASIINSAPTPQYEQHAMNASFSHANSPSDEMVEKRAAAHGFVPREKLEAERTANQILHEEAAAIIGHLNRENQDQAEENAMLKEGIRRLPGAFTRNKPQNRGFEDAEAIENAKAIMNLPPELQEQALGNIKSIPPEATSIEVEHGVMNLPLKSPDDTVPKNEEEAKEMGKMDKLNERLDGTITENKLETNLNTIASKGGVMNIPKSAEGMEVDEGKVFFKKEAVEKMRREGKDISHFTQVINKGENQDVPNGATYYEASITKGHFALPSTANPNASSVIQTEAGEIDISNGGKVFIKKGRVKKKPTSEFQKYERPSINEDMEAVVVATPEEKKALEETMHAAETLGKGTTIIRESLDGGHNVIYKRPLGPPVTIPLEEMLESIKTGKEGPLQKQLTEEGLEVFQAARGKSKRMTRETHESLNILDKSTPTGKTREEDIIKRVLNNTGRSETITVVNGFTNKPGRMKRQIVEEIGMVGEEKRYRRPDGVTITETGGVY